MSEMPSMSNPSETTKPPEKPEAVINPEAPVESKVDEGKKAQENKSEKSDKKERGPGKKKSGKNGGKNKGKKAPEAEFEKVEIFSVPAEQEALRERLDVNVILCDSEMRSWVAEYDQLSTTKEAVDQDQNADGRQMSDAEKERIEILAKRISAGKVLAKYKKKIAELRAIEEEQANTHRAINRHREDIAELEKTHRTAYQKAEDTKQSAAQRNIEMSIEALDAAEGKADELEIARIAKQIEVDGIIEKIQGINANFQDPKKVVETPIAKKKFFTNVKERTGKILKGMGAGTETVAYHPVTRFFLYPVAFATGMAGAIWASLKAHTKDPKSVFGGFNPLSHGWKHGAGDRVDGKKK